MDKTFKNIGASNHSSRDRAEHDYYATHPIAVKELLKLERFSWQVLEPCCGEGHISKVLSESGYNVTSTDIVDRGYGDVQDFFSMTEWPGDIITNPPYSKALDFVKHSLQIVPKNNKVAMLLRLLFLEGIQRGKFFSDNPPRTIYVAKKRIQCAINGDFSMAHGGAIAYAWFVWEKGFKGEPVLRWFN